MRKALWLLAVLCLFGCSSGKKAEQAGTTATPDGANPNVVSTSVAGVTDKTKPFIEQATKLVMKREFGKAFEQLNTAIKTDPKCAAGYFMRAGILADAGQIPLAVADFNKAIELDPKNADFYNARGFFLLMRQQYQPAIKDFSNTIKLNPLHAQAVNNRGLAHVAIGQYKEAIADFTEAVKLGPQNHDAFNNRGYAYFQAGDSEKALLDFDTALRINANNLSAYNNKGLLYFKAEQFEKSAAQFTHAIKRNKLNAGYYRHRREAYLKAGMEAEAREDLAKIGWLQELARLNQVASRSPKDPTAWIERGSLLIKGEEFAAAAESFQQALKVDPKCAAAHVGLAKMNFQQDKTDAALVECEKALKCAAMSAEPVAAKSPSTAVNSLETLPETSAQDKSISIQTEVASLRGDIYLKQGKLDEAIEAFEEAQRFDAQVAEAYLQRSKLRQAKGQTEQAEEDYRQAVNLNPSLDGARQ